MSCIQLQKAVKLTSEFSRTGDFIKEPTSSAGTVFNTLWRFNSVYSDVVCRWHFVSTFCLSPLYYLCSSRTHWAWILVCSRSSLKGNFRVTFIALRVGWSFQWGRFSLGRSSLPIFLKKWDRGFFINLPIYVWYKFPSNPLSTHQHELINLNANLTLISLNMIHFYHCKK